MSYSVTVMRRAQRQLEAISTPLFEKIEEKMLSLANNPRPPGCKKFRGADRVWRIRIGDYRVLYEIDDDASIVIVIKIGHRGDVYR